MTIAQSNKEKRALSVGDIAQSKGVQLPCPSYAPELATSKRVTALRPCAVEWILGSVPSLGVGSADSYSWIMQHRCSQEIGTGKVPEQRSPFDFGRAIFYFRMPEAISLFVRTQNMASMDARPTSTL